MALVYCFSLFWSTFRLHFQVSYVDYVLSIDTNQQPELNFESLKVWWDSIV